MRNSRCFLFLLTCGLMLPLSAFPVPVKVTVSDPQTAPLQDVLVIVQRIDRPGVSKRRLTDNIGAARFDIAEAGLFQVIATEPFGVWTTKVKEFRVGPRDPVEVELTLGMVGEEYHEHLSPIIKVTLLDSTGQPLKETAFLTRSDSGCEVHWHVTDANGSAEVKATSSPLMLVVEHNDKVYERPIIPVSLSRATKEWCDCVEWTTTPIPDKILISIP
jgi:hypothetical protein